MACCAGSKPSMYTKSINILVNLSSVNKLLAKLLVVWRFSTLFMRWTALLLESSEQAVKSKAKKIMLIFY